MLTWWQGRILELGFGQGEDEIYNTSYQPVAHVRAGNGYQRRPARVPADAAGHRVDRRLRPGRPEPRGMRRLAARRRQRLGRPGDRRQDRPGDVGVARARAHPAARLLRADARTPTHWDYVHINSIDPGTTTGQPAALGAQHLDDLRRRHPHGRLHLADRRRARELQARRRACTSTGSTTPPGSPGGLVSVFDNGSSPPEEKQSRGLLLRPGPRPRTPSRSSSSSRTPTQTLLASSQGDLLSLPGGNWLMGYGGLPNFTEYDAAGQVIFDATLGLDVQDFRTYLVALERDADDAAGDRRADGGGRRRHGRGELERRHRRRLVAGPRRRLAGVADAPLASGPRRASRRRSGCTPAARRSRSRRSARRAAGRWRPRPRDQRLSQPDAAARAAPRGSAPVPGAACGAGAADPPNGPTARSSIRGRRSHAVDRALRAAAASAWYSLEAALARAVQVLRQRRRSSVAHRPAAQLRAGALSQAAVPGEVVDLERPRLAWRSRRARPPGRRGRGVDACPGASCCRSRTCASG